MAKLLRGACLCLLAAAAWPGAAAAATTGELTPAGCVAATAPCTPDPALDGAHGVAVSPDGRNVYVAASVSGAVAVLDRDPATGALTPAGCISDDGSGGACTDGTALAGAQAVAVSPDGADVYVAALSGGVSVFARDAATGALTELGCLSQDGSGDACTGVPALVGPSDVAVSPDGANVYVTAGAVVAFARDALTGGLTETGCVDDDGSRGCAGGTALSVPTSVAVSPDGLNVYVTAVVSDAVAVFDRDTATGALTQEPGTAGCVSEAGGACTQAVDLDGAFAAAVAPDGRDVYVASLAAGAVAVLDRADDGSLGQKPLTEGCVSDSGSRGACADGVALAGASGVAVSPDGRNVYASARDSSAVATFDRAPNGALTQKPGDAACTGAAAGCRPASTLGSPFGLAVAPDGSQVFAAAGTAGALTVLDRELPPACAPVARTAPQATLGLSLSCRDANGGRLALAIATPPVHGRLGAIDQAAGTVAYTPDAGYAGPDAFTYTASADGQTSPPATVTLDVLPPTPVGPPGPPGAAGPPGASAPPAQLKRASEARHRRHRPGRRAHHIRERERHHA